MWLASAGHGGSRRGSPKTNKVTASGKVGHKCKGVKNGRKGNGGRKKKNGCHTLSRRWAGKFLSNDISSEKKKRKDWGSKNSEGGLLQIHRGFLGTPGNRQSELREGLRGRAELY